MKITRLPNTSPMPPSAALRTNPSILIQTMIVLSPGRRDKEWLRAMWSRGQSRECNVVTCVVADDNKLYAGYDAEDPASMVAASLAGALHDAGYAIEVAGVADVLLAVARAKGARDPFIVMA